MHDFVSPGEAGETVGEPCRQGREEPTLQRDLTRHVDLRGSLAQRRYDGVSDRLGFHGAHTAIVVDEAQDFDDSWWSPLLGGLKDPDRGGLYVFSDEGQRVFARQGTPPVPLVPLVLDANLRNTRQIAEAFNSLVGQRMRLQGGDGPPVRFVPCSAEDALEAADDAVEDLLAAGWRAEDVALLSTGSRHPEQVERQALGPKAYWDTFWDAEQVFYGHAWDSTDSSAAPWSSP